MAGGLVYNLTAQHQQFSSAMGQAAISINHFHTSTRNAANGVRALNQASQDIGSASRGGAMGVLELSRAAEDAAVSYGTGGLQGAIRGSLNNLTQFAMMVGGPVTGAVAGFAAAGISMAATYFKIGEGAKEAIKQTLSFGDALRSAAKDRAEFEGQLAGSQSAESTQKLIGSRQQEVREKEAQLAVSLKTQQEAERQLAERQKIIAERVTVDPRTGQRVRQGLVTGEDQAQMDRLNATIEAEKSARAVLLAEREKTFTEMIQLQEKFQGQVFADFDAAEREAAQDFVASRRQDLEEFKKLEREGTLVAEQAEDAIRQRSAKKLESLFDKAVRGIGGGGDFMPTSALTAGSQGAFDILSRSVTTDRQDDMVKRMEQMIERQKTTNTKMEDVKRILREKLSFQKWE